MSATTFPELYRITRTDFTSKRLALGALIVNLIALSLTLIISQAGSEAPEKGIAWTMFYLQWTVAIVYGTQKTTSSIVEEKTARTWDLLRLTPLSSFRIGVGKLIAAPLYAFYLALLFLPWSLVAAWLSPQIRFSDFVDAQVFLAATAFFSLSLGLVVSAHSPKKNSTTLGWLGGALGGFILLVATVVMRDPLFLRLPTFFYSLAAPNVYVLSSSLVFFGLWAITGALWKLGGDLLEPVRFWRFPVFVFAATLWMFGFVVNASNPADTFVYSVWAPIVFLTYAVAYLTNEGLDSWKKLRRNDLGWLEKMNSTPVWIQGSLSLFILAMFAFLWPTEWTSGRTTPLQNVWFVIRDLSILQLCRLSKSRKPEILSLVITGVVYLVSMMITSFGFNEMILYFLLPTTKFNQLTWFEAFTPVLQTALLLAAVIYVAHRMTSVTTRAGSAPRPSTR